jgi:hypothetical protein
MSQNDTVKSGKKPAKDASTQRYLPFSEIRENMVMMKDGSSIMVLRVHALNLSMQPLQFMNFSMDATMQAVLISRNGPVAINVPKAERYALHKLIVFGERPPELQVKAQKDIAQAASLIAYLQENEPDALEEAWEMIQRSGKGWISRCVRGADYLQSRYPDVKLDFIKT